MITRAHRHIWNNIHGYAYASNVIRTLRRDCHLHISNTWPSVSTSVIKIINCFSPSSIFTRNRLSKQNHGQQAKHRSTRRHSFSLCPSWIKIARTNDHYQDSKKSLAKVITLATAVYNVINHSKTVRKKNRVKANQASLKDLIKDSHRANFRVDLHT